METNQILLILGISGIFAIVLVFLMTMVSRMRNDRYDLELKKMQLDVMRSSLELKSYEANEVLMSDPARWRNINHLLLEAMRNEEILKKSRTTEPLNNSFFEASGVNLSKIKEIKRRVFVLTPFHERYEKTYHVIKSVCLNLNLECNRGDEEFKPGAVLSHILELMAQASIIIVNIDGRNPNVYYELGIAHAMGKKTVLVASNIESVPFDIQAQRIILYKNFEELEHSLTSFLARNMVDA